MTKKLIKIFTGTLIAAFLVLQFFRIDKANPPITETETLESSILVPADISQIIGRSCNDCHSNKTVYPWYSNIQPSGWFLKDHIDDARRHLNFSIFNTYSPQKKAHKLEEICEMVESGAMPLPSYLWLHGDARLSESDSQELCNWANRERSKIVPNPAV